MNRRSDAPSASSAGLLLIRQGGIAITQWIWKALHLIGIAVLVGGPLFWSLIWRPAASGGAVSERVDGMALRRLRLGLVAGFVLFCGAGAADLARVMLGLFGAIEPDLTWRFATTSQYGRLTLWKTAAALAFLLLSWRPPQRLGLQSALIFAASLLMMGLVSLSSHAAALPGPAPYLTDFVHLIAALGWAGPLIYLAWLPHRALAPASAVLASVAGRFAWLGVSGVSVLTLTGIALAALHLFGWAALRASPYGMALIWKLLLFAFALGFAALNRWFFTPRLKEGKARGFALSTRLEALLVGGILLFAGVLTMQMPPAQTLALGETVERHGNIEAVGEAYAYEMRVTPQPGGAFRFLLELNRADGTPVPASKATLSLDMVDHAMTPYRVAMSQDADGRWTADAVLSMRGMWAAEFVVEGVAAEGEGAFESLEFQETFRVQETLRDADISRRFTFWQVKETGGWWALAMYAAFVALGLYTLRLAIGPPPFKPLIAASILLAVFCGWQAVDMLLVEGFPTSFQPNPVTLTDEVIERGRLAFDRNCVQCHGPAGRGDGINAELLQPPPTDFAADHMDLHTDGDLFWSITKGVPGTGMPAFENALDDETRWILVHYVRELGRRARSE